MYHDEVEIEDFEYDEDEEMYYFPCPCGDRFEISKVRLYFKMYKKCNLIHLSNCRKN